MILKKYPFEFPAGQHQNCQTLNELTVENLPRDGSLGRRRRYRAGADVWQPDDRQDSIYFLLSGQVAVVLTDMEGREVVLRVIGPGEPFGELCFCGAHKQRESTARATTASEAVEIKLADFMDYLQTSREALAGFMFTFCLRLSDAERRIDVLSHRGAEERLGRLLLHLASTRGERDADASGEVTLPVSHDELAQMAAMSRPHVTLTMGSLRRRGLVRYERGQPLAVNVPALKAHFLGLT
ncbi:MAG: Crp/Fnr family transcriptional regulator [Pyrinomonadaceae bacterium]|nr:Crp/Fnr family transcriptional regulator [Pyrinomonadaceae bacterium]MDQ3135245.1 Crp/Fnr family transcriptional regulator [Acidobacteriota bacterium]